ncbi:uroporphyrinogen decarboxylase family protein [bacterium]|nr:uroporphyrinogen decarboxylase family protein [bacterium]
MNGYERTKAALEGRPHDRPPVMLHNFLHAAREAGLTQARFRSDPAAMAGAFIRAVETYGYDGILVDMDTVTLAGAAGVPVDFPEDLPARTHGARLEVLQEAFALGSVQVGAYHPVQVWLEAVARLKEHFRGEVYVRGNCDQAAFALASMLRGMQSWLVDLLGGEDAALEHLLRWCSAVTCQFLRLMAATGADMLSNGDSPAGPELVSPDMYARYALPYEKEAVEVTHGCGLPYTLHICGDTGPILELMPRTGCDALELDYKTDPVRAHDILKDSVTFIGNLDPSGVLALGTPEDVRREAARLIELFSDTPRFILNAGCAIPAGTPAANIRALVESVR